MTLFSSDDHGRSWQRELEAETVPGDPAYTPTDSPLIIPLSNGRLLMICQGFDMNKADHPLAGYSEGMRLIANILEPT